MASKNGVAMATTYYLFNPCTQIDVHIYKDLLELVGSSGAGRAISKLVTFVEAVLTVSFRGQFQIFCAYQWMKQSPGKQVSLSRFSFQATSPLIRNVRK